MTTPQPELFYFYRRGQPVHIHSDRTVFEKWMEKQAWLYPPSECEIVRYIPAPEPPTPLWAWAR